MKRRLPFQVMAVLAFFVVSLFAGATPAHADTIATIDVNASFLEPGFNGDPDAATFPASGPAFYATGQFAVDLDTLAVSSWNITFLGPLGVTYDLSPQDAGVSFKQGRCNLLTSLLKRHSCGALILRIQPDQSKD